MQSATILTSPIRWAPAVLTALWLSSSASLAQQLPGGVTPVQQPTVQQPAGKSAPKASPKAQPKESKEDAGPRPTESQLRARVEQLEEQLSDMQVVIGTLESLGKGGAASSSASASYRAGGATTGGGGVDQARVDSLETQIRALTGQVEQLSDQVRQLNRRGDAGPAGGTGGLAARDPVPPTPSIGGRPSAPPVDPARVAVPGFGSTTVTPGTAPPEADRDPIGRLLTPGAQDRQPASAQPLPPAAANAGSPKELYETAYGYLLQQDYGAAEVAFDEFLRRYPGDRLTADAQYWLGESLYVQRRYKPAGQAFLRVIEKHQASAKVPNSILKLAMTLEQLGQKDCGLFSELETRHPNAPADVRSKARAMKQRVGC